ncbi:MAG: nucleotidyltransferase domain-containing protein [Lewinellaceae bacterium]|nr:nucleotidyltransferase domain-containing protein [Lewinella sp.]MCB9279428.1 nucleotidyltransferase domain-containing protein [Lewinellaceae bacterium]
MVKQDLIRQLQVYFRDQPVLKAYLFGSFARNEQDINSDIDLYLEFDPEVPIGLEFVQMYLDLKELTGREIDLVTEKSISKYLKPQVEREKVLVYERKAA